MQLPHEIRRSASDWGPDQGGAHAAREWVICAPRWSGSPARFRGAW